MTLLILGCVAVAIVVVVYGHVAAEEEKRESTAEAGAWQKGREKMAGRRE